MNCKKNTSVPPFFWYQFPSIKSALRSQFSRMTARKIRKTKDHVEPSHTPRKLKKGDQSVDKKSKEKKPSSGASYQLSPWTRSWQVGVTHRGIYSETFSVHVYHEYGAKDKETREKGMARGNEIIRVAADALNATRNGGNWRYQGRLLRASCFLAPWISPYVALSVLCMRVTLCYGGCGPIRLALLCLLNLGLRGSVGKRLVG